MLNSYADLCCLPLVPGHIRGWGWQQTKLEDEWLVSVLEEKIQEAETSEVSVLGPGAVQWGDGGQPAVWPHVSSHLVSGKVISSQLISQWPPCQDCLEVARCEVSQLTESPSFPTMAAMVRPFVPSEVVSRYEIQGLRIKENVLQMLFCISVFAMWIAHQ